MNTRHLFLVGYDIRENPIPALRPDIRKPLFDGQQRLAGFLVTLRSADTGSHSLDQLRGLEGAAAAVYIEAYFSAFAPALGVTGRNRRPPRGKPSPTGWAPTK